MKREEVTHETLLDALEMTERQIKRSRGMRQALLRNAETFEQAATLPAVRSCYLSTTFDEPTLNLNLITAGFTSEAAPELLQTLEEIETLLAVEPTSRDFPATNQRVYTFNKADILSVVVWVTPDEDSATCHRVIVGIRKTEKYALVEVDEPVYKFQC